jgi:hypothetical protein
MICEVIMIGCVVAIIVLLVWVAFAKDEPEDKAVRWEENLK